MTNFDCILKMAPEDLEEFLDQVYLAGLNNGMYAERTGDSAVLENNPFSLHWLTREAESALNTWGMPDAEEDLLCACGEAILRQAGLVPGTM